MLSPTPDVIRRAVAETRSRREDRPRDCLFDNLSDSEACDLVFDFLAALDPRDYSLVSWHDGQPRIVAPATNTAPAVERPGVGLWLREGGDLPCLVVACDELGNWIVLNEDGYVQQYLGNEVQ